MRKINVDNGVHLIKKVFMRNYYILIVVLFFTFVYQDNIIAQNYENKLYGMSENGKRYYVNIFGDRVTDAIYDDNWFGGLENNDTGWIVVRQDSKDGIIDIYGNEVLPCVYDDISTIGTNLLKCTKDGKCQIFNLIDWSEYIPYKFEDVAIFDNLMFCKKNGFYGAFNVNNGQLVLDYKYTGWFDASKNFVGLNDAEGKWGYINSHNGKIAIPFTKNKIVRTYRDSFGQYLVIRNTSNEYYIYDSNGRKMSIGYFDEVGFPIEDRLRVKDKGLYGFIDCCTGKLIVPCVYDDASRWFKDEVAFVRKGGENGYALISKEGQLLTAFQFGDHSRRPADRSLKYMSVYNVDKKKYGIIDTQGNIIIPFIYDELYSPNADGYMQFENENLWGIVNLHNKVVVPAIYNNLRVSHECNVIAARKGNKWGYIDVNNNLLSEFVFDEAYAFPDGDSLADVQVGRYRGCVDKKGKLVVECGPNLRFREQKYLFSLMASDVDTNIPYKSSEDDNTFAVIIANEDYSENGIPNVQYAQKDGEVFKEYCQKTLGILPKHIRYRENATLNQIRYELNWIKDIAETYNGNAKIIFYYAGHGVPDDSNSASYLLPSDGFSSDVRSAYSLNELYTQLGTLPARQVTVFIDACFSGAKRDGNMLNSARSVVVKAKPGSPRGNVIVFSAAQGNETAYQYSKKKHGMFTYFLLKKLQESKGDATLEELATYINEQVRMCSMSENGKLQTPTVQVSPDLHLSIKDITL